VAPFLLSRRFVASILLIDDDEATREALGELLVMHGHDVKEAGNGRVGLTLLGGGYHPDVILLDLHMPVMDGWQFVESVDGNGHAPPPIIVLSSDADLAPSSRSVVAALRKMSDFGVLLDTIDTAVAA
jgi:CheY-like chemotaxis protein